MAIVLITGAGRGLGRALTEGFLESGGTVFAAVHRDSPWLKELKKKYDARLNIITMDVTDEACVKRAVAQISEVTDRLDVIVNNAGINIKETVDRRIEDIDFENMKKVLDVNAIGPLVVLKHSLQLLLNGTKRLVLNISSDAGSISGCQRKAWYDYCMSKAALNMASKILQNDLRDRGVRVLAVHPGWMKTAMGGVGARIEPLESARKIRALMERKADPSEPIFWAYTGESMEW